MVDTEKTNTHNPNALPILEKIYTYNKIKISKKRLNNVSALLRRHKISVALKKLIDITIFKLKTKDNKYPLHATRWLYLTLVNIQKSVKAISDADDAVISEIYINKGQRLGVRAIYKWKGTTSPKYLESTNIVIKVKYIDNKYNKAKA